MIVCNASYIPSSTIGKTNLIIMMILILVKLLSNIFFWWFSGFLVVRWIVNDYNFFESKKKKYISALTIGTVAVICPFLIYSSNMCTDSKKDGIGYDILFLYYASFDLAEDNTATVDLEGCTIDIYDNSDILPGGETYYDKRWCLNTKTKKFVLRKKDTYQFKVFNKLYSSDNIKYTGTVTYYEKSGFIKNVDITSDIYVENEPVLKNLEIWMETNKNVILINRPEIQHKETDKNLFWYVTKNGEFNECFQAYRKTWTNFLTFADESNYTVTLVTDYDDTTGEYTPISNTIEYTVE